MVTVKPSLELVAEVLNGHPRSISRLISRVEARDPECRPALAQIYEHTGRAHLIGITGVPGSGKSTLVRELALAARKTDRTIGIIAIDPSSPFSGGAILGDRIRMNELTGDPGIFIRSMATRGAPGGPEPRAGRISRVATLRKSSATVWKPWDCVDGMDAKESAISRKLEMASPSHVLSLRRSRVQVPCCARVPRCECGGPRDVQHFPTHVRVSPGDEGPHFHGYR